MRLIDANELMEHVWRDRLDSREAIAEMVNNAPTVRNATWVSVKDRLPEPNTEVLVYSKSRGVTIDFVDAFMLTGTVTFYRNSDVTHWMPLPQKPESEDDEE